jgi:hypothetical protein
LERRTPGIGGRARKSFLTMVSRFHPLNAFLILALLGWLTHRLWRDR